MKELEIDGIVSLRAFELLAVNGGGSSDFWKPLNDLVKAYVPYAVKTTTKLARIALFGSRLYNVLFE